MCVAACSTLTKVKAFKEKPNLAEGLEIEPGIAEYEQAPRRRLAEDVKVEQKPAIRLPTKTPDGQLVYTDSQQTAALPKVSTLSTVDGFFALHA